MSKIITIETYHCYACYWNEFSYKRNNPNYCKYNNKYKEIGKDEVDTKGKNFPAWCPLPDSAVKEVK